MIYVMSKIWGVKYREEKGRGGDKEGDRGWGEFLGGVGDKLD